MKIIDAHHHLHDQRFGTSLPQVLAEMAQVGVVHGIMNGTSESDWEDVALWHTHEPHRFTPAFGLHPWKVEQRSMQWRDTLVDYLTRFPQSSIGECGLDRWRKEVDFEQQTIVFTQHLAIAKELDRPLTIHCLKAWDALMIALKRCAPLPPFLLHSYSGPVNLIPALVRLGAHFSFSGYFLHQRKKSAFDAFAAVPLDRLLIESDAPDMAPPLEYQGAFHHPDFHHPADMARCLPALAALRKISTEDCAHACYENAQRLFRLRLAEPEQAQGIEHHDDR